MLGQSPGNLKISTRCSAVTQTSISKSSLAQVWSDMWSERCLFGGEWKMIID